MKLYEKFKLPDSVLLFLATYAVIGIFGSMFVFIWEYSTYQSFIISAIMFLSGCVVSIFNKAYEALIEKPELDEFIKNNNLDRCMK